MSEQKPSESENSPNNTNLTRQVQSQAQRQTLQDTKSQEKRKLKQEGKQLLLKGCYRMASNKYVRLIDMGIKQFTSRQQAIINLNCGICFQFMSEDNKDNYIRALQCMRNALLADGTYEKTYYRLIQLLRDHGHLQSALTVVPSTIKNKQIDELLKEVRQQYINQSDFFKIVQKYKSQELSLQNGRSLCQKLSQTIQKLIFRNVNFSQQINKPPFKMELQNIGKQIQSLYDLIGTKNLNETNISTEQNTQTRILLMESFGKAIQPAFISRIQDKTKILTVDLLVQPMMKLYRGQLSKFLNTNFAFNNKNIILSKDSMFLSNNQFVTQTKRKIFFGSELHFIKYIRLVDVNMELFGKTFCHLSNEAYQTSRKLILSQTMANNQKSLGILAGDCLQKFILSNMIDPVEVISAGMSEINPDFMYTLHYGGHLAYLYNNLKGVDLSYLKQILDEECKKISEVYGSARIHPVWLQNLKQALFSVDHLLGILLSLVRIYAFRENQAPVNQVSEVCQLSHLIYIYHWQVHAYNQRSRIQPQQNILTSIKLPCYQFNYKYDQLLDYFQKQNQNFIALYLIQKIIQFAQHNYVPSRNKHTSKSQKQLESFDFYKERTIQVCINKTKLIEKKLTQLKSHQNQHDYVYKEMYLILLCIILKLDIKRKIQINSTLIFKELFQDIVNSIALEVLLLILINSPKQLTHYLENAKDVTKLVQNFMTKPLLQQLQPFRILLSVIYMLVCDFENDQELFFASKMGVTQQEIHQVRKLQKQAMYQKQKQNLNKFKRRFQNYIASQWHQILVKMCKLLRITLKMENQCSSKLCKVIYTIAETNHSKLYSTQIIEFMLESRNLKEHTNSLQTNTKQTACKFFQIICKRCNAQIFEYKHLQPIVDSLLWLIANCEHELMYFESLLGLVNLSTMSVRIPIEEIEKCLYEENSYIMHAGVCVMNNILIYSEQLQEENEKNTKVKIRISDLVYKYIEFYRDQIISLESQLPESDYSHPKKIYNSLISLATVLKLDRLEELESWEQSVKFIKILSNNEAPQLLFKLAIYHSLQKKLPSNWHIGLEHQMQKLKKTEPQKYVKLAQMM